ncbi:site-specific recombinase XerD [Clostridium sp. ASBs410]|nr:site-specific recombinase XerD [Clostridium sp. ASBs410]
MKVFNREVSDSQLLNYLLKNSNIDINDVRNCIVDMEKQKILDSHKYEIWQGKDGYWRTYLPKEDKRVLVKKKTLEKIHEKVVEFYQQEDEGKKIVTFKVAYGSWLQSYSVRFTTENTLNKYATDYDRYFKDTDFEKLDITKINEEVITEFIITIVKQKKLCQKACKTLCGYIRNTLKSARINKLINDNPFDNLETKNFYPYCTKKIKTIEERTISNEEYKLLFEKFEEDHLNQPNYIPTYAVEFASLTGFRVSEIAALKWSDIKNGMIVVNKSEKYVRNKKEYFIGETKNGKTRYMPITEEITKLLIRLRRVEEEYGYLGEFIFSNENGRIHAPIISDCARNKCIQVGIPNKSIHAYRRTFSSKLKCNGISSTIVSSLMGHTEDVNEQYYTYDVSNMHEKQVFVQMITKEIAMSRFENSPNEKVINSNQYDPTHMMLETL